MVLKNTDIFTKVENGGGEPLWVREEEEGSDKKVSITTKTAQCRFKDLISLNFNFSAQLSTKTKFHIEKKSRKPALLTATHTHQYL